MWHTFVFVGDKQVKATAFQIANLTTNVTQRFRSKQGKASFWKSLPLIRRKTLEF